MQRAATSFADFGAYVGTDRRASLARLEALSVLLDSALVVPGTGIRLGADAALGLVPGIGDAVSAALSLYIVWEARRLGLPRTKLARMLGNVALDGVVGSVPLLGDLFDIAFKSNRRNMRILREHLGTEISLTAGDYRVRG